MRNGERAMRICKFLSSALALGAPALLMHVNAGAQTNAQRAIIENPIPAPVEKRGLEIELRDYVRLPQTRGLLPPDEDVNPAGFARVSFVRDIADGRRFANDSRGFLYLLDGDEPSVYLDIRPLFPHAIYSRLESGFIGFDFHPEFARNGLFYTVHGERAWEPGDAGLRSTGIYGPDATHHNVITEWRAPTRPQRRSRQPSRALARCAHRAELLASVRLRRVQPDRRARRP
jgi:hypothetical protein